MPRAKAQHRREAAAMLVIVMNSWRITRSDPRMQTRYIVDNLKYWLVGWSVEHSVKVWDAKAEGYDRDNSENTIQER